MAFLTQLLKHQLAYLCKYLGHVLDQKFLATGILDVDKQKFEQMEQKIIKLENENLLLKNKLLVFKKKIYDFLNNI